jgi:group I intron endonuclease
METNNFYVYLHIRKDNGEPFYVGKGKNNRVYDKKDRNSWWKKIVKKYNYDIIFLQKNLTEKEAFDLEKYWIKRIGRRDLELGTLVNLSDGGEGNSGWAPSEETRKKIGNSNKNKKHTEETKIIISNANKGDKNPFYKKLHSKESKSKMSKSKTQIFIGGGNPRAKKVIDIITNKIFDCIKDAADYNNINFGTLRKWLNPNDTRQNKSNLRYL